MGAAIDFMKIEQGMTTAAKTDLRTISALIPYLEQRRIAAQKWLRYENQMTEQDKNSLIRMVDHCNNSIAEILGFFDLE